MVTPAPSTLNLGPQSLAFLTKVATQDFNFNFPTVNDPVKQLLNNKRLSTKIIDANG